MKVQLPTTIPEQRKQLFRRTSDEILQEPPN